ncbi:MAG: DedA family protein [Cellulosilyticaceae bacterium]
MPRIGSEKEGICGMSMQMALTYLKSNGQSVIFFIMFLEGLNLTGIPAMVILPTIGILAAQGEASLAKVLIIAILGSIASNIVYYLIILMVGPKIYDKLYEKFKRLRKSLDKATALMKKYGNGACCIGRLIPGARAVISLMGGIFKIKFIYFLGYSTIGIVVWDGALILAGYLINRVR